MAVRNDITVDWASSPRVITVAAPSTELVLQDLVDTLRVLEDDLENLQYDKLVDAAGKEDLGGGVKVGITAQLQNAKVAFEGRLLATSEGTATSAHAGGTQLNDTGATFQTDGIARGDTVANLSDGSHAEVLSVPSETRIEHTALVGGTENDWDSGESYHVHTVVQCNVSGGNLTAVDDVGADMDSIQPTSFTQVVRTSSSSATLQELSAIQFSSFAGGVWVDVANTSGIAASGTEFPAGTQQQPCLDLGEAKSIATERGLSLVYVLGDLTLTTGHNFDGFTFEGENPGKTTITLGTAASLLDCTYANATITGTLDGRSLIRDCIVQSLTYVDGWVLSCLLEGPVTLDGTSTVSFLNCSSGVAGTLAPIIDYNGSGRDFGLRAYSGGIDLRNKTGAGDDCSLEFIAGQCILANTVTAGTVVIRGDCDVTDNSAGATVLDMTTKKVLTTLEGEVSEFHQVYGLDAANPVTHNKDPANIVTGSITLTLTTDQDGNVTVQRS